MGTEDSSLDFQTMRIVLAKILTPGDSLSYAAGILGSTMAFFLVKIKIFKVNPFMIIIVIIVPMAILFFAAPLYLAEITDQVKNKTFAQEYAFYIIIAAALVWIYSLYQQRVLTEGVRYDSEAGARDIIDNIQSGR